MKKLLTFLLLLPGLLTGQLLDNMTGGYIGGTAITAAYQNGVQVWSACTADPNEINTIANPTSDPNCNESTTVSSTGWGVGASSGTLVSSTAAPYSGSHHLVMTAGDASAERAEFSWSVTSGDTFDISIWARQGSQGTTPYFSSSTVNLSGFNQQNITSTTWTEYTWSVTATATGTALIRCYALNGGATGDNVYIDNMSIVKTN